MASKIITGFSKPMYYVLSGSGNTPTSLGRGVSISASVDNGGSISNWYANNTVCESIVSSVSSYSLSCVIDGLDENARTALLGASAATQGWQSFSTSDSAPYVAIGAICRTCFEGATKYVPVIFTKCLAKPETLEAATSESEVNFQSQTVEFSGIPNNNGIWKMIGAEAEIEGTLPSGETEGTGALGALYTAMAALTL